MKCIPCGHRNSCYSGSSSITVHNLVLWQLENRPVRHPKRSWPITEDLHIFEQDLDCSCTRKSQAEFFMLYVMLHECKRIQTPLQPIYATRTFSTEWCYYSYKNLWHWASDITIILRTFGTDYIKTYNTKCVIIAYLYKLIAMSMLLL